MKYMVNLQVQLEEYVKMGDDLYKVNNQPVPIEEKLQHHRHLVYNVCFSMFNLYSVYVYGYTDVNQLLPPVRF